LSFIETKRIFKYKGFFPGKISPRRTPGVFMAKPSFNISMRNGVQDAVPSTGITLGGSANYSPVFFMAPSPSVFGVFAELPIMHVSHNYTFSN
jgi:hypothetical protein